MISISRNFLTTILFSSALFSHSSFAQTQSCQVAPITSNPSYGQTISFGSGADNIYGTNGSDVIRSGGVTYGAESVRGRGGFDRLVFWFNDGIVPNAAVDNNGHIRIRDFIIDNIHVNPEADSISIGRLIGQNNLDASNIGHYLHIVTGVWGPGNGIIFVNVDGDYTATDRAMIDNLAVNDPANIGGNGTDLVLDFRNNQGNNNFEELSGHPNNSPEQIQFLIDIGFLELSTTDIYGTNNGDNLEGTSADERIFSGGVLQSVESVRGNGGADQLVLDADDTFARDIADDSNGHFRIRDFIIDDVQTNPQADRVLLGDLIGPNTLDANTAGDYFHVISGVYGHNRTGIFVNLDGDFTAADRAALDASPVTGGHGADLFLEFQGQAANNNLEVLTGYADNTVDQLQTILDWGFLDLSYSGNGSVCN